jgi:DinB superfamily
VATKYFIMKVPTVLANFNTVYNIWTSELDKYPMAQLLQQPKAGGWSLGQVYVHLINSALGFHIPQIETCMATNDNSGKWKNFKGFMCYTFIKSFPDIKIAVPPSERYTPKQPADKQDLYDGLDKVKAAMAAVLPKLEANIMRGKTAHPGMSFLNANEWYTMVEMHYRHHLKQKATLDTMLIS